MEVHNNSIRFGGTGETTVSRVTGKVAAPPKEETTASPTAVIQLSEKALLAYARHWEQQNKSAPAANETQPTAAGIVNITATTTAPINPVGATQQEDKTVPPKTPIRSYPTPGNTFEIRTTLDVGMLQHELTGSISPVPQTE